MEKLECHRLAEFYHFVVKDVPFHHQRPTSVAFMEDLTSVSYNEVYKIVLNQSSSDQRVVAAEHILELPTSCAPPLPKGPVMVLTDQVGRGRQLLAQTWLQSSPEFFSLQVTERAREVRATCSLVTRRQEEQKTQGGERKRLKREEYGRQSVLIVSSLEGKIEVTNRKEEDARVEVEYTLQGDLTCAMPECSKMVEKQRAGMNSERKLTWVLEVPAKGSKQITFEMETKEWGME